MSHVPAVIDNVSIIFEIFKDFASEQSIKQVNHDLVNIMELITNNIVRENSHETRERLFSYYLQMQNVVRLLNEMNEQLTS